MEISQIPENGQNPEETMEHKQSEPALDSELEQKKETTKKAKGSSLFEWYDSVIFALTFIVILFMFFVRMITVSGTSMNPTLVEGDRVVVQSFLYTPKCGDVIVVDGASRYGDPLVKRVIAVGGDTIDIDFTTGTVMRNGTVLEEPYIAALTTNGYDVTFPLTVPDGCVFVMGDNRLHSLDSRSSRIGCIDVRDLLGKVILRLTPSYRLELFS